LELKNEDKWINVDPRTKKLVIRFWVKGFPKQFFISTGLKDTKRNREIVRSKRDAIATDIALSRFDSTLNSYQFKATQQTNPAALILKDLESDYQLDLQQLWEKFTEFKSAQLEETSILGKYEPIANYIRKLPTKDLGAATTIRDWMLKSYTHYITWMLLSYFSYCCNWAVKSGLIQDNPFASLKIQKPKKSSQAEDFRAFTLEQRDLIIQAFESHPKYGEYAPLVKFLFFTGCRPGEAFALTWGDISSDCCRIVVNKSRNYHNILKGTKNGIKRVFPCQSGTKLQLLLLSIRPENPNPDDLLFRSKTGKRMNSDIMLDFWKDGRFRNGGKVYKCPGLVKELAIQGLVPYLPPYSCRHTFATWAITSGISPDKVALWIGDTVQTVLQHYCHPEVVNAECPDF
jgi:integrase